MPDSGCRSQNPRSERENQGTSCPDLSPEAEQRLAAYGDLLRQWSARLNLIGPAELPVLETRHLDDSLRLLPLATALPDGPAIDVGSGGGLPGIPLAIADPSRPWRLLEPRRNRAAFLELVVRELGLDTEVVAATAEDAAADPKLAEGHALAVGRALAVPQKAFGMLLPLVRPGGTAALLVGVSAALPAEAEVPEPGLAIVRKHGDAGWEGDHGSGES